MALERAERGQGSDEGSGEGRYSGKGVKVAGRGERGAGRERTRKKPNPARDSAWVGEGSGAQCRYSLPSDPTRHASTGRGGVGRTLQGSINAFSAAVWADSRVGACIVPRYAPVGVLMYKWKVCMVRVSGWRLVI